MNDILFDQLTEEASQHRKNGFGLEPLFTWHGRNVYPFFGAEGEGEGDGDSDGAPDDDEETDTGEGTSETSSETVSREDFDKLRKQLSASDKHRADAEKRLKAIEDGKKDELTKATERVTELEKANEDQAKELGSMRLQNAFLMAKTGVTWHDPEDALDIAARRGYLDEVVGEDGKVDTAKLTAKLKELAKAKPNLVASTSEEAGKSNKGGSTDDKGPGTTGQKVGSKGSNSGKTTEDKVPSRYQKYLQ